MFQSWQVKQIRMMKKSVFMCLFHTLYYIAEREQVLPHRWKMIDFCRCSNVNIFNTCWPIMTNIWLINLSPFPWRFNTKSNYFIVSIFALLCDLAHKILDFVLQFGTFCKTPGVMSDKNVQLLFSRGSPKLRTFTSSCAHSS